MHHICDYFRSATQVHDGAHVDSACDKHHYHGAALWSEPTSGQPYVRDDNALPELGRVPLVLRPPQLLPVHDGLRVFAIEERRFR